MSRRKTCKVLIKLGVTILSIPLLRRVMIIKVGYCWLGEPEV
jgi:hypothetical protein